MTCAGNPINFAMGIKVQEEEDYRSALEHYPLRLTRHFSSADGYWWHNYATRLLVETSRVTLFFLQVFLGLLIEKPGILS